ncbi:MAG: branched-chain amino acid aminotransferase [Saprospiraceae bacterium]|nr:branched-chain amino acid aminotransferase [Saprospiraceae bacterium]MCB9318961.1 branched-chain amino acid aminotransferase [Lewinellaceae bacterium]
MAYQFNVNKTKHSRLPAVDFKNIPFGRVFSDHMFEADYIDGAWTNLNIRPVEALAIHPANLALHYGQSIFEGMKAFADHEGHPVLFRPEMHAKRMNASAARMSMPDIPEDLFLQALDALVSLERDWIPTEAGSSLYLRPLMFATDEYIGVAASQTYKFLILALPVGPYYSKPVKLIVEDHFVRAVVGGTGEAKTAGNYAASLLPARLAREKGYDQVMWMDAHEFKYIQEVGTMNLFFVFKDKIVTPATDGAILKGITRNSFIHILKDWGYKVEERPISIHEVADAYRTGNLVEIFGSGTAAVASQVSLLTFGDMDMHFDESNWEMSLKLKHTLEQIRHGLVDDKFGWVVPIAHPVEMA